MSLKPSYRISDLIEKVPTNHPLHANLTAIMKVFGNSVRVSDYKIDKTAVIKPKAEQISLF